MKEFKRGGFQKDGTYVQQIARKTQGPDGNIDWFPPDVGQTVITRRGPFEVYEIIETFEIGDKKYFRVKGRVIDS
jgi:hypothetical protein